MRGRAGVELVYADDLIVGARGKIAAAGGESNRVDGTEMVAHVAELPRFRILLVVGIVDGLGRPDPHMAICFASVFDSQTLGRDGVPPPAVASLLPSGETWQL